MASLGAAGSFYFVLVAAILVLSRPVICDNDKEKSLFQSLNTYRKSHRLQELIRDNKADCLADKIADKLEDQPCTNTNGANTLPNALPQFKDYAKQMSKCNVDEKTTINGTILPVCVHKLDGTLVLSNYTNSNHAKFLNDSKYVNIGVGSEDDWMVVVLFANTTGGTAPNAQGASGSKNSARSGFKGCLGCGFFLVVGFVHFAIYLLS